MTVAADYPLLNIIWTMIVFFGFVIWLMLLFILPPVAMTMALIWKIKEVILSSVFGDA